MSKAVKNWLIAAAALILAGTVVFAIALALCGGDITKLGTVDYVETTFEPSGDFENISVNVFTTDLKLLPSEDGKCRIECYEDEKVSHTAEVKDGALVIDTKDSRRWLGFISLSFKRPTMEIYLPKNEYEFLDIDTDTGAVCLPNNFTFESININGNTGSVVCYASAKKDMDFELDTGPILLCDVSAGDIRLQTDTGSIKLNGGTVAESIEVKTGTGFVNLENISCGSIHAEADTGLVSLENTSCGDLYAETDTGYIKLENVVGSGKFELLSDTGHIDLNGCDAAELYIETDTGSVSGELLTNKIFFAESDTGHVSVPKSMTGGRCEIKTDTGSIEMSVKG